MSWQPAFLKNGLNNNKGFTLVEVMIAFSIFAVFIIAYVSSEGINIDSSARFPKEIKMRDLAEMKINELIESPPDLRDSLTLKPETKKFEDEEEYTYEVEWKKFEIPDLSKLKGKENTANEDSGKAQLEALIFNKIKENMLKMLWQVRVTIKNTVSGESFSVSTWILKEDAKIEFKGF